MAGFLWLAPFFTILAACSISRSEGLKFPHKKYVVVLIAGSARGPIGRIQVERKCAKVSYRLKRRNLFININGRTGQLKLMTNLYGIMSRVLNNTQVKIEARNSRERTTATVIIVIIPENFGDNFVAAAKRRTKIEKSHLWLNGVKTTAHSLQRVLRQGSEKGKNISMAHVTVERRIAMVKKMIMQYVAAGFGKDVNIRVYLRITLLFSNKKMEHIEADVHCPMHKDETCDRTMKYRTFDGTCNNFRNPNWGASDRAFIRISPAKYFDVDGLNDPIGYPNQPNAPSVPSPLLVSRDFIIDEVACSKLPLTHAIMQFGQFIDHDLDLTAEEESSDICANVTCDGSDADFECPCFPILPLPHDSDSKCIPVTRSVAECQQHGYPHVREQLNENTAFVDASMIYGSTKKVADSLRKTNPDRGLLRSSSGIDGELLPLDESPMPGRCLNLGGCFLAGDSRSNEQTSLAAFHTLFLREHNRIAKDLKVINPHWNGEKVYQETRKIMGAVMQKITYEDFLPLLLGRRAIPRYRGYRSNVNPGILNSFATGAFRFGHSLIRPAFDILDNNFDPIGKPIDLRFMFFNNTFIQENGISPLLRGLVGNFSEVVDRKLSPGIVRHLFDRNNSASNLAALNIQRHRDHGIPGYNEFRKFCKLGKARNIRQGTRKQIKNPENREILARLYNNDPNLVELWVAGLAEAPARGAIVGPTFRCIIAEQFRRIRDGDRFFYKRRGVFSKSKLAEIKKSSLSRIYCDNVKGLVSIQRNAFRAPTNRSPRISCERIPGINLCAWKETTYFRYFKNQCLHGKPTSKRNCRCKCRRPWTMGRRCDAKLERKPVPWHATIVDKKRAIQCSGALVTKRHVLTTAKCGKNLKKGAAVRLGYYSTRKTAWRGKIIKIKKVHYSKTLDREQGLAVLELAKRIKETNRIHSIKIRARVLRKRPTFVTTWRTARFLTKARVSIPKIKVCKKVFRQFSPRKSICTLPATIAPAKRASGSPLVQKYYGKFFLVGILATVQRGPSLAEPRFARYVKLSKLPSCLKKVLRG